MTSAEEFTEFAAAASPRLRRTAFLLCGDWQAAEDLTQATLAKVFVAWRRISRRDAALSYATRTLANTYLAAQRRRRVSELLTSRPPDRAADPGTPELRVVVLDALAALPPKARAVVVLRYWEDLSVEQVAVLLGCSPGNVKSQSARSLGKLRALLGDAVTAADPRTPRRASGPKPETSMIDEPSLRDLLGRAAEPEPPLGPLASRALRAGVRLRRRRLALSGALSAAAAAAVSVVTATLAGAPGRPPVPVTATAEPAPGPSAGQLAHGRWVRIPPAPLKMCGNLAVWDGRALVVIQEPSGGCPLGAAAYDPRVNRWTTIAPPPLLKHQWAVAAAGGGQVLLVVTSGATCSWRPATGRWQPLGTLPAGRNYFSVAWTGTTFLVTRLCQRKTPVPAQAFKLTRGRWTPLPDLPQPATGRMAEAPPVAFHGAVYVLARITVTHHTGQNGQPGSYETGYVQLLRLTPARWTQVPLGPGGPKSELALTQVRGAILAAGSSCGGMCTADTGIAALLRPGSQRSVIRLKAPPGMPYPSNVAAGARAIVVTYSTGVGGLPGRPGPPPGACYIYGVAAGTWQPGPTAPATPRIAGPAYWTPYGVVTLGETFGGGKVPALARIGGWLLRPAGPRSARP